MYWFIIELCITLHYVSFPVAAGDCVVIFVYGLLLCWFERITKETITYVRKYNNIH